MRIRFLDGFIQVSPVPGASPSRRTELRIWHDAHMLFIAIRALDPDPGAIIARHRGRDAEAMLSEDQVTLVIDAEGTGRNAYLFAVNARGAQFDALVYDGGRMRFDWDAQWRSEAGIDPDGWSAVLTIPLRVFGSSDTSTWRFNAERWMPRGSERVRLARLQPNQPVYSLGDAVIIPAVHPGRDGWGLRIKPSLRLTSDSAASAGTGRAERSLDPGLELFHESDGGLRTAAALNIDFGEAEADERSVNLTRFELFRAEKREFFLRDAGRFSFGGLTESAVIPYYSRRVGLDASGRARGLDAGLKLAGTAAGIDFGALVARVQGGATAPGLPDQEPADMAVLRLARSVGQRHRVGLLGTRGNPQGTAGSTLWGIDYQFRDISLAGRNTLETHVWALQSANAQTGTGRRVTGRAWGASVRYPNIGPTAEAEVQRIGPDFEPALGYLTEADVLRGQGSIGWWHRTSDGADVIPAIDWSFRRTPGGRQRTSTLNPEFVYISAAGDTLAGEVMYEQDQLTEGYAPVPGTWIRPGRFRWSYLYGMAETSRSRPIWVSGEFRTGGYYDGRRSDQVLMLGWKPGPRWGLRLGAGRNAIRLPAGRFTARLATLQLDHTPSTSLTQSLLMQWDNVSQSQGVSARLRWRWAPGREAMFSFDRLGYTGQRRMGEQPQTRAVLKLVWSFER